VQFRAEEESRVKEVYSAVVIGSGFGGAVATCRLAQAGIDVAVLERGKRYPKQSFPRDYKNASAGWTWCDGQGLFDVKPLHEMQVVQAAGWGGGSLIYANVHLRPPPDVFARGWPAGYGRESLDPYYDLVAYMLDVKPITALAGELPPKTRLMKQVAEKLGRADQLCYPNIAVELGHPGVEAPNKFGVPQGGCIQCGECDVGCNVHAKNTLDLNYLALAERAGAKVATLAEVRRIEPVGAGNGGGYKVSFVDHAAGGAERFVVGKRVFVCAGAVNTTELLLRCRDQHRTLPAMSAKLGHGYSGNGDFLAASYEIEAPFDPSSGPTITTGIVYDRGEGDDRVWLILQDGGFPAGVAAMTELLAPNRARWAGVEAEGLLRADLAAALGEAAKRVPDNAPNDAKRTAVFLVMGRDRANGRIELVPITSTLRIRWDVPTNLPLYDSATRLVADVTRALGGKLALNPFWKRLHVPVSVHNLGGCVMADRPEDGVTSPIGEVHGYPGLYVLDGSILPSATGVNPSSTIAAVAERNVEAVLRQMLGNDGWRAPEWPNVTSVPDPLARVVIPAGGVAPLITRALGLAFTEVMKGFVTRDFSPLDDYVAAAKAGSRKGTIAEFELTISAPDLDAFLVDRTHAGIASGTLRLDGFTPPEGARVTAGVFNLFVDTDSFYERKMLYLLPFMGTDGEPYVLDGFKEVKDHGHFDVWGATSTLYAVVREGHTKRGRIVATGLLTIHIPDFLRQLTTFKVSGARNDLERASALVRFGEVFMGTLWDVFVRPRLEG
jgi:cholesterol oxidase